MFQVHMRNLKCINMKTEMKTLFPEMEEYILKGIYDETLRGRAACPKTFFENSGNKNDFKWKKIYHEEDTQEGRYKKYIFHVPNILDFVCPDEFTKENKEECVDDLSKFIAILCRRRKIYLDENHALVLLILWNEVGRWRSLDEKNLIFKINLFTNFEQNYILKVLRELWKAGFLVKLENSYGIKEKIEL